MFGYIYKTTHISTGKIYIGLHKRSTFDESYMGSGTKILAAMKEFGKEDFVCELIDTADSQYELNIKEMYWIDYYKSQDDDIGYNAAPGGEWGCTFWTEERCKEQSELASRSRWWNNGEIEIFAEVCPKGFVKGRSPHSIAMLKSHCVTVAGKKWITNGKEEKYIEITQDVPEGWEYGRIKGRKLVRKTPARNKGIPNISLRDTKWVTNGVERHQVKKDDIQKWIDKGFVVGMYIK